jgi:hypothetical protein
MAAARGQLTRHAVPARRKGRSLKGPTAQKKGQKCPECNNGIRDRDLQTQLCLRKERTSGRVFRKTVDLEVQKRRVGFSTEIQSSE